MFKSVRWRSEKNKVAVLFKLRFHATQVSQLEGNALVLTLVPADTGKPTAKLDKCEIRNGCCYWENPIFETVKFIQDPKTGKIHDRIYQFTISTGSSRASVLGEVSINVAEYAGAVKAVSVSLPLKGSNTDVALHVLIQKIEENSKQRELEEHEGTKINLDDKSLKRNFSNGDVEDKINMDSTNEGHLKETVSTTAELNDNRSASIGSDITLSSSDSSSGLNTPRELGMVCNSMLLDSITDNQQRTQWELLEVPGQDSSADDSTNSPTDAFPSERSQLALDHPTAKLKTYLVLLSRKAEMSDLELQTLRKQIVKERKRGQDLLKEVTCLKMDRDAFKEECEKLKAYQKGKDESKAVNKLSYDEDAWALLEETRQELKHERDLNYNLQLQLEKIQVSNSEHTAAIQNLKQSRRGNLEPSAKQVSDIPENLEKRCLEGQSPSDDDEEQKALEEIVKQHADAQEAYILEQRIMDLCSEIEMYRRDKDELEMHMEQLALDYEILKQENHDMSHKLDQIHMQEQLKLQYECSGSNAMTIQLDNQVKMLKKELKEQSNELTDSMATKHLIENHVLNLEHELEKQAQGGFKNELKTVAHVIVEKEQQSICVEEARRLGKLELECQVKKLEGDLKQKSKEHSDALATIKVLEDQIQDLGEELDKQAHGFKSDLEALTQAKVEQEQRAIGAEESLRLTRWKNANTAGRIQDELKRLSMEMQSTFEANEKVATKAMTEASELRLINNHLEESLQQAREELQYVKNDYKAQVYDLQNNLTNRTEDMERENLEFAVDSVNEEAVYPLKALNTIRCSKNEKDMTLSLKEKIKVLEVDGNADGFEMNDDSCKPVDSMAEVSANSVKDNGTRLSTSTMNCRDEYELSDLLKEMALLRENNTSLENELKEMQGRYSEMSVMFAEVEGERQMLVMTLRSLQNGRQI